MPNPHAAAEAEPPTITQCILTLLADGPKTRDAIMAAVKRRTDAPENTISVMLSRLKAQGRIWNPELGTWQLGTPGLADLPRLLARRPLHIMIGIAGDGRYHAYSPTVSGIEVFGDDAFAVGHALLDHVQMAIEAGDAIQ